MILKQCNKEIGMEQIVYIFALRLNWGLKAITIANLNHLIKINKNQAVATAKWCGFIFLYLRKENAGEHFFTHNKKISF